ncbi:sensor histidine kinase [Roseateles saccharophilus]|uniref:sensor histidine kinase n=1 Tax=Roseateles saccharophilus TaxID=304 RepID=UPI00104C279D|nr:sensor histidine kinase [Roseateles saccharophilus]MDG0833611.1 sensor histidine kinase [Roseateles saccharophilus]
MLLWLALLALATPVVASQPVVQFETAEFVLSESARPPPDSAPWRAVELPDLWWQSRPGVHGVGWYRMRWRLDALPAQAQALYLPRLRATDEVFVNGQQVGDPPSPLDTNGHARPRFHELLASQLRQGENTLHLRVHIARRAGLVAPQVGDAATLHTAHERKLFIASTGPRVLFGATLTLGLFMLVLWQRRPAEASFGYFGLAATSFALMLFDLLLDATPLEPASWDCVRNLAAQLVNVSTFVFALRYGGWRLPRLEAALWSLPPIQLVLNLLSVAGIALPMSVKWLAAPIFIGYVAVFAWVAWRRRTPESIALLLASPGRTIWFLLHYGGLGPYDLSELLLPYSFVPLFVVIGWMLVSRFARSLNESEELNAQLEQRVEQKRLEMQQNFQRLQRLEREQAIAEERSRIMSDMHDGIGAHLISMLDLAERSALSSDEMRTALRDCLDDLRLTIDSLEPSDNDLLPVLGNFRYRVDPRLRKQGIELDWQVSEVPRLACLTPRNLLHLLRILQEAFTNVLKHAHASVISVQTGLDASGRSVFIRVRDNGGGFKGEHRGHGLNNMRQRAQSIGAVLAIDGSAGGTTLELLLPVG